MPEAVRAAVALGSNLGDRLAHLRAAAGEIRSRGLLTELRCSDAFETPPESAGDGDAFLNAVAVGDCARTPEQLLRGLLEVESALGRTRQAGAHGGPRTIDLDLILFGDAVIELEGLRVPHPRFHRRAFVLMPLSQVAPDWREPRSGRPIHSLLADLGPVALARFGSLSK